MFTVPTTSSLSVLTLQTATPPAPWATGEPMYLVSQKSPGPLQTGSLGLFSEHFLFTSRWQRGPVAVRSFRQTPCPRPAQIELAVVPDGRFEATAQDECGASEQLGPAMQSPAMSQSYRSTM